MCNSNHIQPLDDREVCGVSYWVNFWQQNLKTETMLVTHRDVVGGASFLTSCDRQMTYGDSLMTIGDGLMTFCNRLITYGD